MAWPRVMAITSHCKNVTRQPSLENPSYFEPVRHANMPSSAQETAQVMQQQVEERFGGMKLPAEQAIAMALDPLAKAHVAALPAAMQPKVYVQISKEVCQLRQSLGRTAPEASTPAACPAEQVDEEDFLMSLMTAPPSSAQGISLSVHATEDTPEWQRSLDAKVLYYFQSQPAIPDPRHFDPLAWWKEKYEAKDNITATPSCPFWQCST
eukprot:2079413-Pleurochrysis_carterae.AAC.2